MSHFFGEPGTRRLSSGKCGSLVSGDLRDSVTWEHTSGVVSDQRMYPYRLSSGVRLVGRPLHPTRLLRGRRRVTGVGVCTPLGQELGRRVTTRKLPITIGNRARRLAANIRCQASQVATNGIVIARRADSRLPIDVNVLSVVLHLPRAPRPYQRNRLPTIQVVLLRGSIGHHMVPMCGHVL